MAPNRTQDFEAMNLLTCSGLHPSVFLDKNHLLKLSPAAKTLLLSLLIHARFRPWRQFNIYDSKLRGVVLDTLAWVLKECSLAGSDALENALTVLGQYQEEGIDHLINDGVASLNGSAYLEVKPERPQPGVHTLNDALVQALQGYCQQFS